MAASSMLECFGHPLVSGALPVPRRLTFQREQPLDKCPHWCVRIRARGSQTREPMRRKLMIAGLSALLLLAALLLLNRKAVRVGYYRWQFRTAADAAFVKKSPGLFLQSLPGVGDAQSRYSRARQALLDLGYLSELKLPFPVGSDWSGLVRHARERFPEGFWELSLDQPNSMIKLTAPTHQVGTWKKLVAESADS